jgi:nitrogen fixation NifU-like protein
MDKNDLDLGALYRETVMDHYRSPRGHKKLDRIDITREGYNPVCGDKVRLSVKMSEDGVEDIAVDCKGCAISVASASMLAELLPGKSRTEIERLAEAFRQMMHGKPLPEDLDLGDLDALEGVQKFPVRIKCALLAWMTLLEALHNSRNGSDKENAITSTVTEAENVDADN